MRAVRTATVRTGGAHARVGRGIAEGRGIG